MSESLQARRSAAFELPLRAGERVAWLAIAQARWAPGEEIGVALLAPSPRPAAARPTFPRQGEVTMDQSHLILPALRVSLRAWTERRRSWDA